MDDKIGAFNSNGRYGKAIAIRSEVLDRLIFSMSNTSQLNLSIVWTWYTPVDKLEELKFEGFVREIRSGVRLELVSEWRGFHIPNCTLNQGCDTGRERNLVKMQKVIRL